MRAERHLTNRLALSVLSRSERTEIVRTELADKTRVRRRKRKDKKERDRERESQRKINLKEKLLSALL